MSHEYTLPSKNKNWPTITKLLSEFDAKHSQEDLIVLNFH
jgi:hypothetical protein